ncbi:MAG: branched-chain amino acid ABC transporter permease [Spirochaetes bacterium]|nr:branched-chain amino acid ABC transporter permease [Spirochaetota bacterium]
MGFIIKEFFPKGRIVYMDPIIIQVIMNGLIIGGFYSLIGIGLNIIFGVMDVVNFAQGEFLMIGMYIAYLVNNSLGLDPYYALPLTILVLFGLGLILQHYIITPVVKKGHGHEAQIFLTVAFMMFLQNIALLVFSSNYYSVNTPYSSRGLRILDITLTYPKIISFGVAIVLASILFLFLKYTDTGRALRATAQNRVGASIVGIRIERMYILAFAIGVTLAGIAGNLLVTFYYVYPTIGNVFTNRAFIVVVMGGLGSIPGALIGGLLLGLLETLGSFFIGASYKETVVFVTFIIILIVRRTLQMSQRSVA